MRIRGTDSIARYQSREEIVETVILRPLPFAALLLVILDRVLRKLVEAERKKNSRKSQTTMLIVDSKSIQNADTTMSSNLNVIIQS